ncbi:MAG TPA: ribonuclease III [Dongiaceae bacterium]|jgi:ribonuclease-3|nr:ribonuclease III [Dongiaceae bacterium]
MTSDDPQRLGEDIGYVFRNQDLLRLALTHASVGRSQGDYQRLEFLGDRVLGLVIADLLYEHYPQENEGAMARRLAALVRMESCAEIARTIRLGDYLILSHGEAEAGGRKNNVILGDACEALIGAIYRDGGFAEARRFIERYWRPLLESDARPPQDAKTGLQEWAQGRGLPLPNYRLLGTAGPAHDLTFTIEVSLPGYGPATAQGKSKRIAEQEAAKKLLSSVTNS